MLIKVGTRYKRSILYWVDKGLCPSRRYCHVEKLFTALICAWLQVLHWIILCWIILFPTHLPRRKKVLFLNPAVLCIYFSRETKQPITKEIKDIFIRPFMEFIASVAYLLWNTVPCLVCVTASNRLKQIGFKCYSSINWLLKENWWIQAFSHVTPKFFEILLTTGSSSPVIHRVYLSWSQHVLLLEVSLTAHVTSRHSYCLQQVMSEVSGTMQGTQKVYLSTCGWHINLCIISHRYSAV